MEASTGCNHISCTDLLGDLKPYDHSSQLEQLFVAGIVKIASKVIVYKFGIGVIIRSVTIYGNAAVSLIYIC